MAQLSSLFSPGRIGAMSLKNRIVLTAMGVGFAEPDGTCGERIRAFFEEQARGGAGLINMGVVGVGWPVGSNMPRQVAISEDRFIPGIRRVAQAVHAHGSKLAVQLHFGGLVAVEDMLAGRPAWTPSLPTPKQGDMLDGFLESELREAPFTRLTDVRFKVMTAEDIRAMVDLFAAGARRAREAGADGVELHGGHGYLISGFLSPLSNRRTDEYGGELENRARLLLNIITGIRREVGPDFPLWCKLDSQEFGEAHGITLEDAKATARLAECAGADAITVTSYHDTSRGVLHSGSHTPDAPGLMIDNAAAIKAAVGIPVIAAGRISPELADRNISAGRFDFVAMGRKLLADPQLPRKLEEGRAAEIRPCIYCYTCISEIYLWRSSKCAVNPEMGFERDRAIGPAAVSKHVAVIGGGPAGMEAARRLALKGHRVTLIERADRLGGTLVFASLAYEPNEGLLDWLKREVKAQGVEVMLNTAATEEVLRALGVDEVVVATGARRDGSKIPGSERPNVFSGDDLRRLLLGVELDQLRSKISTGVRLAALTGAKTGLTRNLDFVREATRRWMPLGPCIVIIGGELVGLELAEFLAHRGRAVTVIGESAKFGAGLPIVRRWRVLHELDELQVRLIPGAADISIHAEGVRWRNAAGESSTVPADHIILATAAEPDLRLAGLLKERGFVVHSIGDCTGVGYIAGAMEAAADVAVRV